MWKRELSPACIWSERKLCFQNAGATRQKSGFEVEKSQSDQEPTKFPLNFLTANLLDLFRALQLAQEQEGVSSFTLGQLIDVTGALRDDKDVGCSSQSFKKGGIVAEFIPSWNLYVDKVLPYYPGVVEGYADEGKSWATDPKSVPSSMPNIFRGGTIPITYPYQLAVYGAGIGTGNFERVLMVKFQNMNDYMSWYNKLKPR